MNAFEGFLHAVAHPSIVCLSVVCNAHAPWLRGPSIEHWSLADVLSLSCARLVADG